MKQQRVRYYDNTIHWFFNGEYHRNGDLPARYYLVGGKLYFVCYYQHGKYHRTTGPAIINYWKKNKSYLYQDKYYASLEQVLMVEACR